jgi:DNA-binding transcriptional ArsR family regulator
MLYRDRMSWPAQSAAAAPSCDVFAIDQKRIQKVARRAVDDATATSLAGTFRLLGNGTRIRILDALRWSELCVCDLAVLLNMKISAVSHQLALLKKHRIVKGRREGKMMYYSLDDDHVRVLFKQGLAHQQHAKCASPMDEPPGSRTS